MKVRIEEYIDYGHRLPEHLGKCKNIHGHTAKIAVEIDGAIDPETGMVIDFSEFKSIMKSVLDEFDHALLIYDRDPLKDSLPTSSIKVVFLPVMPTAENLAKKIREMIAKKLEHFPRLVCMRVEFWETPTNCAIWDIR